MEKNNDVYYNQATLWNKTPDEYQFQVLVDILDMMPNDVESILDVGCGDGYITNALPDKIKVVGMDISEEALKYVKREKVIGDITKMPFSDNSFDLVMVNDVIEHIPDEQYQKALSELVRVSKKYIIITVPNNEDIESKKAKCADCGCEYHINWHQRSYNEDKMISLICDKEWNANEIRYSGTNTLPMKDLTMDAKQKLNYFCYWENSVCPNCNSSNKVNTDKQDKVYRTINAVRHNQWFSANKNSVHISKSEIIALYSIEKPKAQVDNLVTRTTSIEDLLKVDFSNKMQGVYEFTEGCDWSRFRISDDFILNDNGISAGEKNGLKIEIRLPTIIEIDDLILIEASNNSEEKGKISLYAMDGISTMVDSIGEKDIAEKNELLEFPVDFTWTPDKFGIAMDVYIYGDVTIHSLTYKKKNKVNMSIPFWNINKGNNIFCLDKNNKYKVTLGMYSDSVGKWPQPSPSLDTVENVGVKDIFSEIEISMGFLSNKINRINNTLNNKEMQREQVEKMYSEVLDSENLLKKDIDFCNKCLSRKAQRVLIFSHMFPTPSDPVGGSFIHEQVRALRENEGIDARVISCKPFWINGLNINKIKKANKVYVNELMSETWTEYKGVPVMYLPYKVGKPFFPFSFHSNTYSSSIMKRVDDIWKDFKFDIIHAHTAYLDGNAAMKVASKYKVPYVITEHTGPFSILTEKPIIRRKTLKAIKEANKVLAVSDSLASEIRSYYTDNKIKDNISVLYNGVSTDIFKPLEQKNNMPKNKISIMYVGYLEEVKNPINLINAFSEVNKKIKNTELNIVGDGTLRTVVEEEVEKLGIKDKVNILGIRTRENVASLIKDKCDIFVLPSKAETFGVVLIEALASGKPVVSTKCGGPESIIKEQFLGELCDNDNPHDLSNSIIKVIENLHKYNSDKIREYAIKSFDFKVLVEKLSNIYQQM